MNRFKSLTNLFNQPENQILPHQFLVGLERETIRVTPDGQISQQTHPLKLGSTLTHPAITTDFAEAQIELVTSDPVDNFEELVNQMTSLHAAVSQQLDEECLWPLSICCIFKHNALGLIIREK